MMCVTGLELSANLRLISNLNITNITTIQTVTLSPPHWDWHHTGLRKPRLRPIVMYSTCHCQLSVHCIAWQLALRHCSVLDVVRYNSSAIVSLSVRTALRGVLPSWLFTGQSMRCSAVCSRKEFGELDKPASSGAKQGYGDTATVVSLIYVLDSGLLDL